MKLVLAIVVLAGCELIANIPDPGERSGDDAPLADGGGSGANDADPDGPPPECLVSSACTTGAAPVCGADHSCRECIDDPECGSGVCLPDGACADAARFLYAAPNGTGATCTAAAPCTVDTAVTKLSVATDIVKLAAGTYVRTSTLDAALPGILAGGGATFQSQLPDYNFVFTVPSTNPSFTILGLSIVQTDTANMLSCDGATVKMVRTSARDGNVGMLATTCALEFDRVRFTGFRYYAVAASLGTIAVRNSYFVANGRGASTQLAALQVDRTSGLVEASTIANNGGILSLLCQPNTPVRFRNLIATGSTPPGIASDCAVDHSLVDATYASGANNLTGDPRFVDPATGNFHITATSPARGVGDPLTPLLRDADGDLRPNPAATPPDVGADEIP